MTTASALIEIRFEDGFWIVSYWSGRQREAFRTKRRAIADAKEAALGHRPSIVRIFRATGDLERELCYD